jgi:sulfide:quinone oxidoreductase
VPGAVGLFGAGDAVSLQYAPRLPKSGVTAVRMGPILAHNLGVALGTGGTNQKAYRPKLRALALFNTGDGSAILSYSGMVASGRWAMMLKDGIDRRFVRRFKQLEAGTPAGGPS